MSLIDDGIDGRLWNKDSGRCNGLLCEESQVFPIEKRQEEDNLKAFENRIDEALSIGAENREAAIKWILQAEGLDKEQDSGYICYTLGLSYDKEHLFQTKH